MRSGLGPGVPHLMPTSNGLAAPFISAPCPRLSTLLAWIAVLVISPSPPVHHKAVAVCLVEVEEQAAQIRVAENVHGEVDSASFYAIYLVLDRGNLHARIA